ncbi:MAG: hypothetical protein SGPRY_011415 [Prymnesium sp.]
MIRAITTILVTACTASATSLSWEDGCHDLTTSSADFSDCASAESSFPVTATPSDYLPNRECSCINISHVEPNKSFVLVPIAAEMDSAITACVLLRNGFYQPLSPASVDCTALAAWLTRLPGSASDGSQVASLSYTNASYRAKPEGECASKRLRSEVRPDSELSEEELLSSCEISIINPRSGGAYQLHVTVNSQRLRSPVLRTVQDREQSAVPFVIMGCVLFVLFALLLPACFRGYRLFQKARNTLKISFTWLVGQALHKSVAPIRGQLQWLAAKWSRAVESVGCVSCLQQLTPPPSSLLTALILLQFLLTTAMVVELIVCATSHASIREGTFELEVASAISVFFGGLCVAMCGTLAATTYRAIDNDSKTDIAVASCLSIALGLLPMTQFDWALCLRSYLMADSRTRIYGEQGFVLLFGCSLTVGLCFGVLSLVMTHRPEFGWKVFMRLGCDRQRKYLFSILLGFRTIRRLDFMCGIIQSTVFMSMAVGYKLVNRYYDELGGMLAASFGLLVGAIAYAGLLSLVNLREHTHLAMLLIAVGVIQPVLALWLCVYMEERESRRLASIVVVNHEQARKTLDGFHIVLTGTTSVTAFVRLVLLLSEGLVIAQVFGTGAVRSIRTDVSPARQLTAEARKRFQPHECSALEVLLIGQELRMGITERKDFEEALNCQTWPAFLQLSLQLQTLRWSWSRYIGIDQASSRPITRIRFLHLPIQPQQLSVNLAAAAAAAGGCGSPPPANLSGCVAVSGG